MKRSKSNTFFRHIVIIFSVTYLLGSFTNMLFIPRYTSLYPGSTPVSVLTFSRRVKCTNFHSANFLQIIDRSTFDNDRYNTLRCVPKNLVLIFKGPDFLRAKLITPSPQTNIFYNRQHSYISFCTFRI